jgi:thioesterase domain-containing protein/NAD(P)-dependent dehydrogenase (short-subunit alcohol dehydrogenase family)/acyl carrier protein
VLSNGMQAVGGEMVRFPEKATLLGPVRVIPHEVPGFTVRSIDIQIDGSGSADDRERRIQDVAREVSGDVLAKPSDEIIAYRDGGRFVETLMPAGLQRAESPLRRGGTYLITGGLGGLGLVIARHLAESYAANLVLVSRQCLPSRESWEAFAAKVGRRDRTGQAIAELREIEALGGRVLHVAADVANIEQMRDGLSAARARFGTFDGVIHAAGVLDDGPLLSKSVESMEAVIAPKVHGATLLAELLADDPLQFFVAFSSTSAFLGPAGQVDYAAANAFLNAFAKSQRGRDVRFSAIDWGVWKDIGAGKAAAERLLGLSAPRHDILVAARHPMLSGVTSRTDRSFTVVGSVSPAQHWVLDEHRLESGQAVLPGTGYVELIAAAFREATGATKVAFNELSFLQPMFVSDEGATILQIVFSQSADGFDFEVSSQSDGATATVLNAIGSIDACDADETRRAMPAIEQPPDDGAAERPYRKQRFLKLGERWSGIERIVFGKSTAWADITLPTRFIDDLTAYQAHPAALDLATGFALELVAGYVPETDSFVPMAYGGLRLLAPLQRRVRSRVKLLSGSVESGLARFAVEITDLNGNRLVEIDRFDMRYLKDASGFGRADAPGEKRSARPALSRSEQSFVDMVACGITAKEGMTVLEQFLGARRPGPVVATSIKVPTLLALSRIAIEDMRSDKVAFERPTLDSEYEAPRDAIEKTLAQIWQNLLGVAEVGINDDFFELGGHSLIAVRLFARIKQEWGIEHPISSLFGAPTIARLADILRADIGDAAIRRDARGALPHGDSRIIVPMTKIDRDLPALFIVAGMFGNVLNLRHLASHLSDEYAVYGVQARGLLGEDRPHTRFEDMARDYIEEIQKIQPTGPYLLGGFSGGGIIAYEIAQQLRARGDTVASLVMLDTITPQVPSATTADKLRIELMRWRAEGLAYPIERLRQRRAWFKAQANKSDGALMPAEFRSREIEAGFRAACASYQVQPYYGRVDLFCPPKPIRYRLRNGRILNQYREYLDQTNHWSRYIRGQIIVHDVPGDHDSLVLEPHVRVLKKAISAVLKAALEGVCDVNEDVRSAGPGRREANTRALPPKEQSLRPQF